VRPAAIAAELGIDSESQTEKLAKETQNPVANLISVPFQNNFNFDVGPREHFDRMILNEPS
jgi:hypothetical protein